MCSRVSGLNPHSFVWMFPVLHFSSNSFRKQVTKIIIWVFHFFGAFSLWIAHICSVFVMIGDMITGVACILRQIVLQFHLPLDFKVAKSWHKSEIITRHHLILLLSLFNQNNDITMHIKITSSQKLNIMNKFKFFL